MSDSLQPHGLQRVRFHIEEYNLRFAVLLKNFIHQFHIFPHYGPEKQARENPLYFSDYFRLRAK